jgi:regulator of RNase E activity RraA
MRKRLLGLSSTALVDALGRRGAVASAIRRLTGERLAGRAVTAACEPESVAAMFRALRTAGDGDVLCVAGGGGEFAYLGDLAGAEAARRRLAGVVVDGLVRDLEGLKRLGLTIFARGTVAVGGVAGGAGDAGVPIEIGGQFVRPGDWLLGDADGLVVVPAEDLDAAVATAEAAAAAEAEILARVAGCTSLFDLDYRGRGSLGSQLDGEA